MSNHRNLAQGYIQKNKEKFLGALKELLIIPSISTDPAHGSDMVQAAEWVASQLNAIGMQRVNIFPTNHHPVVFGEWLGAEGAPTVLIYGHYDVQPADPVDLWKTDPFTPVVRGENIYARGASDMKGQVIATLKAVEAIVNNGPMPVNVKWLIEGEEEIGSPSLPSFIEKHKDILGADFCLNPDSGMLAPDAPAITYALRGLAYFELRVHGPAADLHSGIYGGVTRNPAIVLADLIAGMHDSKGRVTLPGFYKTVRPLSKEERSELSRLPMDDKYFLENSGANVLYGEDGYSVVERVGARPTLDVNGILSGFTGEGSKTVIPAWAMAKISMRLVPDQDPEAVHRQLMEFLERKVPLGIRWELNAMAGTKASICERDHFGVRALSEALETSWQVRPYFKREGGSVPVVGLIQNVLGMESVLTGFGLPDDNLHAPNEKLHLPTWYRGIEALAHYFFILQDMQ